MIVLWVTLLVLHHGYSLLPVITVQVGEPVTITCDLPNVEISSRQFYWYKQSAGDTLKIIVTLWRKSPPNYAAEFSEARWKVNNDQSYSNLTIVRTTQEDEGMYHCAITEWINTVWSGTYLFVKGKSQRTSNYTVVQQPTVSDPVRPGDSVTLQCSVLFGPEQKTCPGDHSVYWFRAGSDESHPEIIYTDKKRHDQCQTKPDAHSPTKSCIYHLTQNISTPNNGMYYCAVATCREILFGHGTKLDIVRTTHTEFIVLGTLIICLAISVVGNVVLICNRRAHKQLKGMETAASDAQNINLCLQVQDISEDEEKLNYAALNFSRKTRGRKKEFVAEDSLYSELNC